MRLGKSFVCGLLMLLAIQIPVLTEAGTATYNTNVYNANSVGCDMLDANRYEEAMEYFIAALNQEGDFAPAWLGLGSAFYATGKYDTAIECAQEDIRFCDGNAQFKAKAQSNLIGAYFQRGIQYEEAGEYDKAIKDYSRAIEINSKFANAYYGRGIAYQRKGEYDKAIADYSHAIELNPKQSDAYTPRQPRLGVIDVHPKKTDVYNNRGNAYKEKGEYDKAIADYNRALELDPHYLFAYYNRAVAYKRQGALEQALDDCEAYLRDDPADQDAKQLREEILEAMQKK